MKAQSRKFIVATSAISIMALSYAAFNQSNTNPTAPVKTNSINQSTTNSLSTTPLSVATPKLKSTIQAPTNSNTPIKNQYIVVLNPLSELPSTTAKNIAQQFGGKILFVYSKAVRGFAISIPETASEQFIQAMQRNPQVNFIEQDAVIQTNLTKQSNPSWGLDRIDQNNLPLSKSFSYENTGAGVNAYVVDTGVLSTHQEFTGRIQNGFSAINDGRGTEDCDGHGTHVAGTLAGTTYGVAKNSLITPVRVLDCNGSGAMSGVISGLDWIIQNGRKPAVVNMSLGGSAYSTLDTAVDNLVNNGFITVVAAGNSNTDACNSSPARAAKAITVAATDSSDNRASYSNYGNCVDLFAPGSNIASAWIGSNTATANLNGTSMASPHVAGVVATLLESSPTATVQTITTQLLSSATANVVLNVAGSPNKLLYNTVSSVTQPTTPTSIVRISQLTGSSVIVSKLGTWRANVIATVTDSNNLPIANATVSGGFSVGGTSVNCTTNSQGQCQLNSGNISRFTSNTKYSVKNISGTNMTYASSSNIVSSVTIYR